MYATPTVQVGVLSKKDESTLVWKNVDGLPWQQSRDQLIGQNIALTGWTFQATVSERDKPKTGRIREYEKFTVILPNNVLAKNSWFELHQGVQGLVDGSKLLDIPLYWEFEANLNQAKMPVLLLYPTSRKIE